MILSLNIAIIVLLLGVFYQDVKERQVTTMLLGVLFVLAGFLHSRFHLFEIFMLNIMINFAVVGIIVLILLLYTRVVLKKQLFKAFGLGDLVFFLIMAVGFPTPTFLVVFSSSLCFAFITSMVLKKSMKEPTVPLAGFQALFMVLLMTSNFAFNFIELYRI
jgi:hypothetical protein